MRGRVVINYVIYDPSGHIIRCGTCKEEVSQIQNENEFQLNVDWPSDIENYTVTNGELTRKSEEDISAYQLSRNLENLRAYRDVNLSASDWTQSPDSPLTDAKKQEWATYRQALRDLPANTTDPANPTWPTKPS